jgi:hypothetical protein
MSNVSITVKIWLSVGVYILGYMLSTGLSQIQSGEERAALKSTSDALFPAAQHGQKAQAAFERMVKGFGDAVIMQDSSGVDRAAEDGRQAVAALKAEAAIAGISAERSREAGVLATSIERIAEDGHSVYGSAMSGAMSEAVQDQLRGLASRTDETKAGLAKLNTESAADLHRELEALGARSSSQSSLALAVFAVTLVVAGAIVHYTIRRAITGPVVRVIGGVQEAADGAARASAQIAQSGTEVSASAQEQAACVEETSASLEEISATTRQNADRAGEADKLMQTGRQTVDRAARAMNDLTSSMGLISKSSHQVAAVLKNIDEIAFHTNILALNAAVEAARAGQAGAGFSVVADEVRALAHRAAEAARNSGSIVEQTVSDVAKGVTLVSHARAAFDEVSAIIANGSQIVSQISSSSDEQARGITNIGQAIARIESLTQRNAANAQETADGAAAMNTQMENTRHYLEELVVVVGMERR